MPTLLEAENSVTEPRILAAIELHQPKPKHRRCAECGYLSPCLTIQTLQGVVA